MLELKRPYQIFAKIDVFGDATMRVTIHQPNFIPRIKVLQKLSNVDIWIILDSVQYVKQEWQNRSIIVPAYAENKSFWVTVPVSAPNGSKTIIRDIRIYDGSIISKIRLKLNDAFSGTLYRHEVLDYWDEILSYPTPETLAPLSTLTMLVALKRYGTLPKTINASNLAVSGAKSKLVANLCMEVNATEYVADSGGLNYLDISLFDKVNITWQEWDSQAQISDITEWRNTGFVNLLARKGPNWVREHLADINLKKRHPWEIRNA